jgi:hypothetical protein
MSEPDLSLIGRQLIEMQAEMRTIRSENALSRQNITNAATSVMTILSDRIAQFEVAVENRLNGLETRIEARLDQTERSLEERLTRIEAMLARRIPPL